MAAVSGASELYRSDDGGQDWSTVYSVPGGPSLTDLGFTTATRGTVVVGGREVPLGHGTPSQLLVSTDGGASWRKLLT